MTKIIVRIIKTIPFMYDRKAQTIPANLRDNQLCAADMADYKFERRWIFRSIYLLSCGFFCGTNSEYT